MLDVQQSRVPIEVGFFEALMISNLIVLLDRHHLALIACVRLDLAKGCLSKGLARWILSLLLYL